MLRQSCIPICFPRFDAESPAPQEAPQFQPNQKADHPTTSCPDPGWLSSFVQWKRGDLEPPGMAFRRAGRKPQREKRGKLEEGWCLRSFQWKNSCKSKMFNVNNFFLWKTEKVAKFHSRVEIISDTRKSQRLKWPWDDPVPPRIYTHCVRGLGTWWSWCGLMPFLLRPWSKVAPRWQLSHTGIHHTPNLLSDTFYLPGTVLGLILRVNEGGEYGQKGILKWLQRRWRGWGGAELGETGLAQMGCLEKGNQLS